ncbi:MAG: hypothetical protein CME70_02245 [Halobacteriovorax sp.]|nr:hypothetical protein [Halobacteriovorax sp.]|tara:strand:- start:75690 stop:76280 length:591 start_codon:yes stop_codon:yes gene_type:complete
MRLLVFIALFLPLCAFSSEWRNGDIILLPLNCYSCRYIESETGAPFSHSGLLIKIEGKWRVTQSLGEVKSFSVNEFLSMGRKGEKALHIRAKYLKSTRGMAKDYTENFRGLPFDSKYLWNNFDLEGRELLYCSEFITKLLNNYLAKKLVPKKMDFRDNWEYWYNYYSGDVPQGEPGNSPADFYFSKDFLHLRNINL